jgi:hypothetical protein
MLKKRFSKLAIIGFILSLISLPPISGVATFVIMAIVGSFIVDVVILAVVSFSLVGLYLAIVIAAIVLGILGIRQINRENLRGKAFAIASIVIASVSLVWTAVGALVIMGLAGSMY